VERTLLSAALDFPGHKLKSLRRTMGISKRHHLFSWI
jgi:hypothetical protein